MLPSTQDLNRKKIKQSGSLSDGSVCDVAPLTKSNLMVFRNQHFQKPYYIQNGQDNSKESILTRKRYSSGGDREQTYSSGYETSYKKGKYLSNSYTGNPVMENRISSSNDIVQKCTEVQNVKQTYTLEERVQIAATAVVYNNCKIVSNKFKSLYPNKTPPDFKTIFAWRQSLLKHGCLVDSHLDHRKETEKSSTTSASSELAELTTNEVKSFKKLLPNPDEILLDSDSENERSIELLKNNYHPLHARNSTLETINVDQSHFNVTPQQSFIRKNTNTDINKKRTESFDSAESNYPDTDSDHDKPSVVKLRSLSQKSTSLKNYKKSPSGSDSESASTGEQTDYFTNYGKPKRKFRRKITSAKVLDTPKTPSETINVLPIQRYSTVKSCDQSPLVTGNIYAPKLRMTPKKQDIIEVDACSTEYVPTKMGATTKRNYQQFKDNVIKRGYWAKGNGVAMKKNIDNIKTNVAQILGNNLKNPFRDSDMLKSSHIPTQEANFATHSVEITLPADNYVDKSSRFFDLVQSNCVNKNQSITDIFNTNDMPCNSSPNDDNLEKYDQIRQMYEKEWDEEDDALYRNENDDDVKNKNDNKSLNVSIENVESQTSTPQKNIYGSPSKQTEVNERNYVHDVKERRDQLLSMLTNLNKITERGKGPNHNDSFLSNGCDVLSQSKYCSFPNMKGTNLDNVIKGNSDNGSHLCGLIKSAMTSDISRQKTSLECISKENSILTKLNENSVKTQNFSNPHNFLIRPTNNLEVNTPKENNNSLRILSDVQIAPAKRLETENRHTSNSPQNNKTDKSLNRILEQNDRSVSIPSTLIIPPIDIPDEISKEMLNISKLHDSQSDYHATHKLKGSDSDLTKNANLLNTVTELHAETKNNEERVKEINTQGNLSELTTQKQLNFTNILQGIDANALMLALKNLQEIGQKQTSDIPRGANADVINISNEQVPTRIETINLTNDEDWEKESDCEESIEKRLEKLDGNTGDTPFLGDIFDPGPVIIPPKVAQKLNLPIDNQDVQNILNVNKTNSNDDTPVAVGSFKSFALPKPILLNRLKLRIPKAQEKNKTCTKKIKQRKKLKVCIFCSFWWATFI